jgi:hypothetical protein
VAKTTIDTWNADFFEQSPLFDAIQNASLPFAELHQWPTLEQFSCELGKNNIRSHGDRPVHAVAQGYAPEIFDDYYESRIYLKGELQTRLENWHDFFNAMCWLQFPKTKAALNALHFEYSKKRQLGTNRSPLENAITLFDECGAVIVADEDSLLDLIRNHQWKSLFWNRQHWNTDCWKNNEGGVGRIRCYVFGHAMYEKALTPYLGMTAHAVLIKQAGDFFRKSYLDQLAEVDRLVSDIWLNKEIESPKGLHPFPLLGVPGWWSEEQDEEFYSNKAYFRSKNSGKAS